MAEPKKTQGDYGHQELYHNSGGVGGSQVLPVSYDFKALFPGQGVGDNQRVGDQIYTKGIGVKMLLGLKADRHNCTFRFIVWTGAIGSQPSAYSDMFDSATGNVLLDCVNTDRGRVIVNKKYKPKFVDVNASNANKEYTTVYKFWIPWRRLIKFNVNGGTTASTDEIRLYVFAYDAYGTLKSDTIAYFQTWAALYYKDP